MIQNATRIVLYAGWIRYPARGNYWYCNIKYRFSSVFPEWR